MRFGKSSLQYALAPPMPLSSIGVQRIYLNTSYNGNVPRPKTHLDVHGVGLCGQKGAEEVIKALIQNPTIQHLVLGNNKLGDEGIELLFTYLSSPLAKIHRIVDISLNSCTVGNRGFDRIAQYLDGNTVLEALFLQNNTFNPPSESITRFANAVNNSQLKRLSFTSNQQLSDAFLVQFLSILDTRYLQELHLSAMALTQASTAQIAHLLSPDGDTPTSLVPSYDSLDSPRNDFPPKVTRIRDLRLNGNSFSIDCYRQIVTAVKSNNFSLQHLEIFANQFAPVEPTTPGAKDQGEGYDHYSTYLIHSVARNRMLMLQTAKQALQLLMPARVLLLPPKGKTLAGHESSWSYNNGTSTVARRSPHFPWRRLPTELQLLILQFVSPNLSARQYVRIWKYAADWDTLEKLRMPPLGITGIFGNNILQTAPSENTTKTKKQRQEDWLFQVECDRFQPFPGWLDIAFDWFTMSGPLAGR